MSKKGRPTLWVEPAETRLRENDLDVRVTRCFLPCRFKRSFTIISENREFFLSVRYLLLRYLRLIFLVRTLQCIPKFKLNGLKLMSNNYLYILPS